jgi:hypothetical protein
VRRVFYLLLFSLVLASCVRSPGRIAPGLNRASIAQLKIGMKPEEVTTLLGLPLLENESVGSMKLLTRCSSLRSASVLVARRSTQIR